MGMEQARAAAPPVDPERANFLAERRRGIGGSDAAAILGISRWSSPLQVWLEKRNEAPPQADDPWLWWGRELEGAIARRYELETGCKLWKPPPNLTHPKYACLIGNPDRLVLGDPNCGVELKTARTRDDWGEPGSDEVPHPYLIQAAHYMAVTGRMRWDFAVVFGGFDFAIYTVRRDLELEDFVVEKLVAWWRRHIVVGERPAIDGSESTRRWLAHRFPHDALPIKPAPVEAAPWAVRLFDARQALQEFGETRAECENALKEMIGEAAGIEGFDWRATWRLTRPKKVVNHSLLAEYLYQRIQLMELELTEADMAPRIPIKSREHLLEQFTELTPGTRRFLVMRK